MLGCHSRGRSIGQEDDDPRECGVMIADPIPLQVARNSAKRSARELPFEIWKALAKATPLTSGDV